jgi:hypothetical protein
MWVQNQGSYSPEFEEVHARWGDYNIPPGYGHSEEQQPLYQYGGRRPASDGLFKDAKHHLSEDDYAEQDEHEMQAGMSKHHCTDIMCTVMFLIAVA